jgi:hypothetical protein
MRFIAKSPITMNRNRNSLFSASKTRNNSQTRKAESFNEVKSPKIVNNHKLLRIEEEKMWTSIHCDMIHSMKQKVRDAKKLRGFFSPNRLMQKINDVRKNNNESETSLSIQKDVKVINMKSSRYHRRDITTATLRHKFKAANCQNPAAFIGNIF